MNLVGPHGLQEQANNYALLGFNICAKLRSARHEDVSNPGVGATSYGTGLQTSSFAKRRRRL